MAKRSLFDQLDQAITQLLSHPESPVAAVDPKSRPWFVSQLNCAIFRARLSWNGSKQT